MWLSTDSLAGRPGLLYFLNCLILGPHRASMGRNVVPCDWATWNPSICSFHLVIFPLVTLLECHVATPGLCHIVSLGGDTSHLQIGPFGHQETPNQLAMWQPLVLPHQHANITFAWLAAHVICMDVDVSMLTLTMLTKTFIGNIFFIQTLLEVSFAPLENSQ
jgi:hypothetical protein